MLCMLSFQMKGQNGYVKYQTFDEYKLMGIGHSDIRDPYVLVKKEADTIFVIKSNDSEKTIKYVNKGDYWHTILQIEEELPFFERICEKFIYNDTIIEYEYLYIHKTGYLTDSLKRSNQRRNSGIYIHTKKDCLILSIAKDDIKNYDDPFNEIKELVINYKEIFPYYSPGSQTRWHTKYEKHIEWNTLSIYEINGENKEYVASKQMNNLGEFDNKGILAWWY